MFATFLSVALFASVAVQGASAQFTLYTPTLNQCQPANITWSSTTGPYNLIAVSTSNPCDDIIAEIGDFDGTSATWTVNATSGTSVTLSIEDGNGEEAWSGAVTVGDGDDSCLSASSLASNGSSSDSGSSSSGSSSASGPASSPPASTTLVVNPEASPSGSLSGAASGASSSGAVPVGAAGANLGPSESGALNMYHFSAPIAALTVLAAVALSI